MNQNPTYHLGYSSCPNDTFIFKAIAKHLIDIKGYDFNIMIEDVETLNQDAAKGAYDITKLSFAAFGNLIDQYALLRAGSALGLGCGPMIISLPGKSLDNKQYINQCPAVAVPGMGTTAYHLFKLYLDDLFPDVKPKIIPMPFEQVMPKVLDNEVDFGIIIHEGRFVYETMGLELKADLGQWWEDKTNLPIPLGCIAIKRDIDPAIACEIQTLIRQSIDHAFLHPEMANDYIQSHAQELNEDVIQKHISLYVNEFSKELGNDGEAAITTFLDKARGSGLIKQSNLPIFAC